MNILRHYTWRLMRYNRSRTIATILGILLATTLFCTITTLASSLWLYIAEASAYRYGSYHASIQNPTVDDRVYLTQNQDIAQIAVRQNVGSVFLSEHEERKDSAFVMMVDPSYFDLYPAHFREGRAPEKEDEVAVTSAFFLQMKQQGIAAQLGDTVEWSVFPYLPGDAAAHPDAEEALITCKLVGILDDSHTVSGTVLLLNREGWMQSLETTVFLRYTNPYKILNISRQIALERNSGLLACYGLAGMDNTLAEVFAAAAVLVLIILVAFVGIIQNAFLNSISQRIGEMGLLVGIGATKRQIRQSVTTEAQLYCLICIPLGLLLGVAVAALVIGKLGSTVLSVMISSVSAIELRLHISLAALLLAAMLAGGMVYVAAIRPIRQALRITPISAIRQEKEYTVGKKVPVLFPERSLPRQMAKKYYATSRRGYRQTVICLAVSVFLLISATGASTGLRSLSQRSAKTSDVDFTIYLYGEDRVNAFASQIAAHESVSDSFLYSSSVGNFLPFGTLYSQKLSDACSLRQDLQEALGKSAFALYALEDEAFLRLCAENGIDPDPYFDLSNPTALVLRDEASFSYGVGQHYYERIDPFDKDIQFVYLNQYIPDELRHYADLQLSPDGTGIFTSENPASKPLPDGSVQFSFEESVMGFGGPLDGSIPPQDAGSRKQVFSFRLVPGDDGILLAYPEGKATDPLRLESVDRFQLGARVDELPLKLGIQYRRFTQPVLIVPLSSVSDRSYLEMALVTNDYTAMTQMLSLLSADGNNFAYDSNMKNDYVIRQSRNLLNAFAAFFIAVMVAACITNVFNTLSAGIFGRRRDYGMFRSLGMAEKDIRAMVCWECVLCGYRALLWSLPPSVGMVFVITWLMRKMGAYTYVFPLWIIPAAIALVASVVIISIAYALRKLRTDTPMEAVRPTSI